MGGLQTCPVCDKVFTKSSDLDRHFNGTHLGIKNFKCSVCNGTFAQKSNLTTHMNHHFGEKPYRCPKYDLHQETEQQKTQCGPWADKAQLCRHEDVCCFEEVRLAKQQRKLKRKPRSTPTTTAEEQPPRKRARKQAAEAPQQQPSPEAVMEQQVKQLPEPQQYVPASSIPAPTCDFTFTSQEPTVLTPPILTSSETSPFSLPCEDFDLTALENFLGLDSSASFLDPDDRNAVFEELNQISRCEQQVAEQQRYEMQRQVASFPMVSQERTELQSDFGNWPGYFAGGGC